MSVRDDRAAFRRRLGVTLGRVRTKLTTFTQETIAERLTTNTETIGRWERGEREPKVFDLHRLWQAYGVPGDWLLEPTDSVTELDRRIADLRIQRLREGAAEAGRLDVADEQTRRTGGAEPPPRGTPPRRTQPRKPQ